MTRTALIGALLAVYAGMWLHGVYIDNGGAGFDPFSPRAAMLAARLGSGQYTDALPLVRQLESDFPDEPELLLARARIWHGLRDVVHEAGAWEQYVRISSTPAEACPSLGDAYDAAGQADLAIRAYERCVKFEPDNPDLVTDLARAYERRGRAADALTMWRRAAALDPDNPWLRNGIARTSGEQ